MCGAGGDLVTDEATGRPVLKIAENGLIRDRNDDRARAEHLNEINKTRDEFFAKLPEVKDEIDRYKSMQFPHTRDEALGYPRPRARYRSRGFAPDRWGAAWLPTGFFGWFFWVFSTWGRHEESFAVCESDRRSAMCMQRRRDGMR